MPAAADHQCAMAASAAASIVAIARVSWNSRTPSMPCSRPTPDCFIPPNGARRSRRRRPVIVDPDVSADELRPDALRRCRIGRPYGAAQAAPCVIREPHRLVLVIERDHRDDGTELLLASRRAGLGRRSRRSRAQEVAAGQFATGQLAEFADVGSGILRLLDDLVDERLLRGECSGPIVVPSSSP